MIFSYGITEMQGPNHISSSRERSTIVCHENMIIFWFLEICMAYTVAQLNKIFKCVAFNIKNSSY